MKPLLALVLPLALSLPVVADTINLTDGTTLTDVEIQNELLTGITYKAKGKNSEQTLNPDAVLSIEYSKLPKDVDEAETMIRDNAFEDAAGRLKLFLDGVLSGENKKDRQAWAPAYAMMRMIEMRTALGDAAGVTEAADLLLEKAPDSRFVPAALLAKAEAQRGSGKGPQADATLQSLRDLVGQKNLSERWSMEADLAVLAADANMGGATKREKLKQIADKAGASYPLVRNRARLAEGETFLAGSKPDLTNAQKVFDEIVSDPQADEETLAGAFTGLGFCHFNAAAETIKGGGDGKDQLQKAILACMRVIVNYKDQSAYVPQAMYFAGRSFDFYEDDASKANARRLYGTLMARYPGNEWAKQAKNARR